MKIIPAIDIIAGKCIRLCQGDFSSIKTYNENPVDFAKKIEDCGLTHLHLVDLDGAKSGSVKNIALLEKIATQTNLSIEFGGGLSSDSDLESAMNAGAKQLIIGSMAVTKPKKVQDWITKYGSEKIILAADTKNGKIATSGWQNQAEQELLNFIKSYIEKGIHTILCTDIAKDGMLKGPSVSIYKEILNTFSKPVNLLASGGISTIADLNTLKKTGCAGAIVGKAIYEQHITLKELKEFQLQNNA